MQQVNDCDVTALLHFAIRIPQSKQCHVHCLFMFFTSDAYQSDALLDCLFQQMPGYETTLELKWIDLLQLKAQCFLHAKTVHLTILSDQQLLGSI